MRTTRPYSHGTLARAMAALVLALGPALAAPVNAGNTAGARTMEEYRSLGLQAAMKTKAALGGELMNAIEAGGPENAVAFCNTRALPITAAMSSELGVALSRVSDQPRNPANRAKDEELAIIAACKDALAAGEQPAPALREHGEAVTGYYPIVTNGMCLACHGREGEDISPATQAAIDSRYPDDQATGYGEKELRGLFVVEMGGPTDAPAGTGQGSQRDE